MHIALASRHRHLGGKGVYIQYGMTDILLVFRTEAGLDGTICVTSPTFQLFIQTGKSSNLDMD